MTFENETKYSETPTVQFGFDAEHLDQTARGHAALFWNGNRTSFVHRVLLDKLQPDQVYCKSVV